MQESALIYYNLETGEVYVMNGDERHHVYYIQRELSPEQASCTINRDNGYCITRLLEAQ